MGNEIILDVTDKINNAEFIDIGYYDYAVLELSSGDSASFELSSTNDLSLGSSIQIGFIDLSDNTFKTSVNVDTLLKIENFGKFIQSRGGSIWGNATLRLYKN
jgi:hypothetical protein